MNLLKFPYDANKQEYKATTRSWKFSKSLSSVMCFRKKGSRVFIQGFDSFLSRDVYNPRRARGSQSGREKRRDESFQIREKELLGTESPRTISKNSSAFRLLIGQIGRCIIVPNRRTVSPEFFSWVNTRRLFSRQTSLSTTKPKKWQVEASGIVSLHHGHL